VKERLQKIIARAGLGSRREIDQWISDGKVTVNGRVARPGDKAGSDDRIACFGKPLKSKKLQSDFPRVLVYNKPLGEVCTRKDEKGRKTVFTTLPKLNRGRWIVVGRLDINTSGLLLFTTDGELANRLMHPSSEIDREYAVRVMGNVDTDVLGRLRGGVELDGEPCRFTDIQVNDRKNEDSVNRWFYCVLMEGKNREVRRLWESQGLQVNRLKRVRYGPVFIPGSLKEGQWEEVPPNQVSHLYEEVGLKPPAMPGKKGRASRNNVRRAGRKPKVVR
jgi:23S rRNA pseudouridine2605 synthase